jgi:hypothetical protein
MLLLLFSQMLLLLFSQFQLPSATPATVKGLLKSTASGSVSASVLAAMAGSNAAARAAGAAPAASTKPQKKPGSKWDTVPVMPEAEVKMTETDSCIKIQIPKDKVVNALINRLAKYVAKDGQAFEAMLIEREVANPAFKFLFERDTPESNYYRWKVGRKQNGHFYMAQPMSQFTAPIRSIQLTAPIRIPMLILHFLLFPRFSP